MNQKREGRADDAEERKNGHAEAERKFPQKKKARKRKETQSQSNIPWNIIERPLITCLLTSQQKRPKREREKDLKCRGKKKS